MLPNIYIKISDVVLTKWFPVNIPNTSHNLLNCSAIYMLHYNLRHLYCKYYSLFQWDLCRRPSSGQTQNAALVQRGLTTRTKTMFDLKDLAQYPAAGPRVPLLRPVERRDTVKRQQSTTWLQFEVENSCEALVTMLNLIISTVSLFPRAVFVGHLCCRSVSTGRLSDKLLKAVFGHQLDRGSCESLNSEKPMDTNGMSSH